MGQSNQLHKLNLKQRRGRSVRLPTADALPHNPTRKQMEEYAMKLDADDAERIVNHTRERIPFEKPVNYGFRQRLTAAIIKLQKKGYQFPRKSVAFK